MSLALKVTRVSRAGQLPANARVPVYSSLAFPEDCELAKILMVTRRCLPHPDSLSLRCSELLGSGLFSSLGTMHTGFLGLDNRLSPTEGNLVLVVNFLCFPNEVLALLSQSLLLHSPQTNFTLGLIFYDSVGIKA